MDNQNTKTSQSTGMTCQGRDEAWKEQTIANTSEAQFEQEYGNSFLGTGNTLINSNTLLGLKAYDPEWSKEEFYMYQNL